MRVTNMMQIKHNKLRIPTGGRLTSCSYLAAWLSLALRTLQVFILFFFARPTFTRGRAMGNETFYWDGLIQNNCSEDKGLSCLWWKGSLYPDEDVKRCKFEIIPWEAMLPRWTYRPRTNRPPWYVLEMRMRFQKVFKHATVSVAFSPSTWKRSKTLDTQHFQRPRFSLSPLIR